MTYRALIAATLLVPSFALAATKPKPKPAATAKPAPKHDDGPSVSSAERPLADGAASFKFGKKDYELSKVGGSIQTSSGFQIASVKFEGAKGFPKLQLDFMYTGTGPIDATYITNVFAIDEDKEISAMKAHVSTCSIVLAKATANMVEGTATCPKGMFNAEKPGRPITEVKFRAEAK